MPSQHETGTRADGLPTWAVVMTVREPLALVMTNLRWHLATGAAFVHVFLDDPDDPVATEIRTVPGCRVTVCDRVYWARERPGKGRPESQMRRQTINANVAKRPGDADWLFHIDADEFIVQDAEFAVELSGVQDAEINLRPFERLFRADGGQADLFEGQFRASADLNPEDAHKAHGPFDRFMKRGQYSHGAGKSGVQTGSDLRLGVHNATVRQGDTWRRAPKHVARSARLLHFDGLTPLHWATKFLRYRLTPPDVQDAILQPHRQAQIDWMLTQGDTLDAARAAHKDLFALTEDRVARLQAFDLLHDITFEPLTVIGGQTPDLSPDAFDAALLARNPWIRELMGDPGSA